jgi:hypothetical protein
MSGANTTKNNLKHSAQRPLKKRTEKSNEKNTSGNEWCKYHQKQPQKHCPKSGRKKTLENRTKNPQRKMSGASTIKNDLQKNCPQSSKSTLGNIMNEPHKKMVGASTIKNNLKNIAQNQQN